MGVTGLMSFVRDNNGSLTSPHQLRSTELVLDGNNLIYQIFHRLRFQWTFGGDYDLYAQAIRRFFNDLRACEITCMVIFDGCYEPNGVKFKTTMSRAMQRLHTCRKLNRGVMSGSLLPPLAPEVFVSTLNELQIPHLTGPYEADLNIAAYAHHHNCPVASNDSDFYIFDLPAGYIPIDTLDFHVSVTPCECCPTGQHRYIACSIYHRSKLRLPRLHGAFEPTFLPLLSTLMGNDFSGKDGLNEFFANVRLPRASRGASKRHSRTESLLLWLQNFDRPEAAVRAVLAHIGEERREAVQRLMETSLDQYCLESAWLLNRERPPFLPEKPLLWEAFEKRALLPAFANAAACGYVFLLPAAEDLSLGCIFDASQMVRCWLYNALGCRDTLTEYSRKGRDFSKKKVPAESLSTPSPSCLREAMLALNVSCPDVSGCLQDLLFLLCFWFVRSSPKGVHLNALLLSIVCNLERFERPELASELKSYGAATGREVEERSERQRRLMKFLDSPCVNNGNPLDLVAVHHFGVFQTIVQAFTQFAVVSPDITLNLPPTASMLSARSYYNLCANLKRRMEASLFIQEFLGRQSRLNSWFWAVREQIACCRDTQTV